MSNVTKTEVENIVIAQGSSPHQLEGKMILEINKDDSAPKFFTIPDGITAILRHKVGKPNANSRVPHKDIEIIGDKNSEYASFEQREFNPMSKKVILVSD